MPSPTAQAQLVVDEELYPAPEMLGGRLVDTLPPNGTWSAGWVFTGPAAAGCTDNRGTPGRLTAASAQAGRAPGFVFHGSNDSLAQNVFAVTRSPDAVGARTAVTAWFRSSERRATRVTSATVTCWNAATASFGDWRPSTTSACDHASASSAMEVFRSSARLMARRCAASTRSASRPVAAATRSADVSSPYAGWPVRRRARASPGSQRRRRRTRETAPP